MRADQTPVMGEAERAQAARLSLAGLRPPARVPGYEQERFLGRGAYGEVWVAVNSNTGRKVAIKFYHRRGGLDWSLLSREVEKLRHLFSDRYVVQLLEVGWEADPPYYVMEFMESGSLEDRLAQGPLPAEEAVALAREVAVGLVHAHGKGILHCDLKPANIMLDPDGRPRLADFGQSRLSHEHSPALGTLFYMAPEQADLGAAPDARWDVYALGAVLYRMLTGEPPYRTEEAARDLASGPLEERLARYRALLASAPPPAAHRAVPGVDAALAGVIDRCLAVNPRKRYPNVQAVLDALDARAARRARRPLLVLGLAGPVLLLLVVAAVAGYLFALTVSSSKKELTALTLEGNGFAAQFVADRFGLEIDRRWRMLEREAADPDLRARLRERTGPPAGGDPPGGVQPYQAWIEDVRRRYAPHFVPALRPASWMLYDRSGVQIARSPVGASLGKSWWHRDYFHGLGHDLDPRAPGATPLPPARAPHRSAVFESRATRTLMVAFSVPVWPGRPGEGDPVGLLAMTGELGHFAAFEAARNQFAVLVDLRPGEDGERGLVVEHPALDRELQVRPSRKGFHMDAEFVARAERLGEQRAEEFRQAAAGKDVPRGPPAVYEGGYHDPVLGEAGGEWLATLEPVIVKARGPAAAADTGWVVVVQQRAADALRPVESLRRDLLAGGLVALALVAAVITALWGFVIIVLNAAPESRLTGFLRRRLGLPSSASPGSSAASASQRTPGGSGPTPGERDA